MNYTKGQKVNYIGKGFLGYDESQNEMKIVGKMSNTIMSYWVEYLEMTLVVYANEIEKQK